MCARVCVRAYILVYMWVKRQQPTHTDRYKPHQSQCLGILLLLLLLEVCSHKRFICEVLITLSFNVSSNDMLKHAILGPHMTIVRTQKDGDKGMSQQRK